MNQDEKESSYKMATFAGGCFWCMVAPFQKLPGVVNVVAGYIGGHMKCPTYADVCAGGTGHYEAVQVTYDPGVITYEILLDTFWRQIDPTDQGGQFYDRGKSYQTAIFYHNDEQRKIAETSKRNLEESGLFKKPIASEIIPATEFYPAEDYHQDYHKKSESHYKLYRRGSGRDEFIKEYWNS